MPAPKPEIPPSADDPAESQRFIDMARKVGVDESPEAFERTFKRIVRPYPLSDGNRESRTSTKSHIK